MTVFCSRSADFCFQLPHLLALPTEAWQGAEIHRRSAENSYVNLPGPKIVHTIEFYWNSHNWIKFSCSFSCSYLRLSDHHQFRLLHISLLSLSVWIVWRLGQCYKTFFSRCLRMFVVSLSVCPWQAFQSLVLCLWVRLAAYSMVEHL